jgi:hypothetical protein
MHHFQRNAAAGAPKKDEDIVPDEYLDPPSPIPDSQQPAAAVQTSTGAWRRPVMLLLLVLGGLIFRVILLLAPLQLIVFIRQSRSIYHFFSCVFSASLAQTDGSPFSNRIH